MGKEIVHDAPEHGREEDWEEMFNGHADSKPRGPMPVGIDFAFPFAQNVYGIPEHASPLSLPTTTSGSAGISPKYEEPYRLYTLDVFEYELDNPMALYGSIPLMLAHGLSPYKDGSQTSRKTGLTTGVFWFNPSETFIDVSDGGSKSHPYKQSRWLSETGNLDFFILPGPSVKEIYSQYTTLRGTQALPP